MTTFLSVPTWRSSASSVPRSDGRRSVRRPQPQATAPLRQPRSHHLTSSSVARRPQTDPSGSGRKGEGPTTPSKHEPQTDSSPPHSSPPRFLSPSSTSADSSSPSCYSPTSEMANAASGVAVNDECKLKFLELQSKRLHRFITYKVENQKEIIVDKIGDRETSYEDFTSSLPENDCRYAIYDFDFVTAEDVQKSRIFYILWSPDTARVRSKMLYASSNESFKRMLNGIQVELQATDAGDISIDAIKERAR